MSEKKQRNRALIEATVLNDLTEMRRLLAEGADVDARDAEHGETPLMFAHSAEAARLLLQAGADVNVRAEDGITALLKVTGRKAIEMARLLLDAGADINAKNSDGETALMYAVRAADIDRVRLLVERGADVNVQDIDENTALSCARDFGLIAICDLLRSAGAK